MTKELEGVQNENIYDTAIKKLNYLKADLLKECYEYLGIDFGETKNNVVYLGRNEDNFYTEANICDLRLSYPIKEKEFDAKVKIRYNMPAATTFRAKPGNLFHAVSITYPPTKSMEHSR